METIKIKNCIKKGKYFLVYVENEHDSHKIHPEIALFYGLKKDKEIISARWNEIIKENELKLARSYTLNLLSTSFKTEFEITRKLKLKKYNHKIIDILIEEMKNLSLVNDKQFANDYATELARRGFGKKAIIFKLKNKGISEKIIESIIQNSFDEKLEYINLKKVFDKKMQFLLKTEKNPLKRREKIYRFLCSKGFSHNLISDILCTVDFNSDNMEVENDFFQH